MATKRDEYLWKKSRERALFRLGIGITIFMIILYFAVAPTFTAITGKHLELPDAKVVIMVVVSIVVPALGLSTTKLAYVLKVILDKMPEEAEE